MGQAPLQNGPLNLDDQKRAAIDAWAPTGSLLLDTIQIVFVFICVICGLSSSALSAASESQFHGELHLPRRTGLRVMSKARQRSRRVRARAPDKRRAQVVGLDEVGPVEQIEEFENAVQIDARTEVGTGGSLADRRWLGTASFLNCAPRSTLRSSDPVSRDRAGTRRRCRHRSNPRRRGSCTGDRMPTVTIVESCTPPHAMYAPLATNRWR